jgi:hypothetical protein
MRKDVTKNLAAILLVGSLTELYTDDILEEAGVDGNVVEIVWKKTVIM